jgi:hypothetical protein
LLKPSPLPGTWDLKACEVPFILKGAGGKVWRLLIELQEKEVEVVVSCASNHGCLP